MPPVCSSAEDVVRVRTVVSSRPTRQAGTTARLLDHREILAIRFALHVRSFTIEIVVAPLQRLPCIRPQGQYSANLVVVLVSLEFVAGHSAYGVARCSRTNPHPHELVHLAL